MRMVRDYTLSGVTFIAMAIIFSLFAMPSFVNAAINPQINFQGKLTNPNGTNVTNGTYAISFNIYTAPSGGSSIWTENHGSVSVTDGIFRVALGSITPLPGSVDFNSSNIYLGITVGADPEMVPRVQFTAAPYAFNSDSLDGIDSSGFAQLGRATAQTDTTTNALIFLNKTSTGNLLQLQQGGLDRFLVNNSGVLTTASVNAASIIDGTITNADLVNSGLTVTAGSGLTTGGAVSLGGTVTLNIGAGNGITVNADDIAVRVLASADGLSATTSSGSGMEVLATGVGLLQGCADTQVLKWNETSDVWACGADATTPGADSLNFTEFADALALDAATTISLGANNLTTNLNGTGDYVVQFAGNTVFQILDTGAVTIGTALADQTIGIDNGTGTINISTDADANITNIGTGTGADTVTIGDANANVAITDGQWSISGAGAANFASVTGAGLTDCDTQTSKLLWDSATGQFSCGTDRASASVRKTANEPVTSSIALQDDNELLFAVGASQTWVYEVSYIYTTGGSATPDIRVGFNGPAGSTCVYQATDIAHAGNASAGATACNTALSIPTTAAGTKGGELSGSITTGVTAGDAIFRWAQNTSSVTSTVVTAGSSLTAFRLTGADYAETYFSGEIAIQKGQIVALTGEGRSQVGRATQSTSDRLIGIVSTQPGQVIGAADGFGFPVQVALAGRLPVKLSTENGLPKAGDMITVSSSMPGYGMKATQSGYVVGQLMMDAIDNGDGSADGFVFVRNGYWQAPVQINFADIFKDTTVVTAPKIEESDQQIVDLGLAGLTPTEQPHIPFDQALIESVRQGFSIQQEIINELRQRVESLEQINVPGLLVGDAWQLDDTGITFLKQATFANAVTFQQPFRVPNSAGVATMPAEEREYKVVFNERFSSAPKVLLTPNGFIVGSWRVKDVSEEGFSIEFETLQKEDVEITWQAVLTE